MAAHLCRGADLIEAVTAALYVASQSVLQQGAQVSYIRLDSTDLPMEYWPRNNDK